PRVRATLIDFATATIMRDAGFEQFDAVAGGETAGIPFAAWMADRLGLPMLYVRKKPKGFGRNSQIEGHLVEGQRVLLVEDMTSDGRSKVNFCAALRQAGAKVEHALVFFFYDIFPEARKILGDLGVTLHSLATWWDVLAVAKASGKFDAAKLAEVEKFMHDPAGWSKAHGGGAAVAAGWYEAGLARRVGEGGNVRVGSGRECCRRRQGSILRGARGARARRQGADAGSRARGGSRRQQPLHRRIGARGLQRRRRHQDAGARPHAAGDRRDRFRHL